MHRWSGALAILILLAALAGVAGADDRSAPERGACYCRATGVLECTANLTERECARRCNERLADDYIWLVRRPCWNWGYGG